MSEERGKGEGGWRGRERLGRDGGTYVVPNDSLCALLVIIVCEVGSGGAFVCCRRLLPALSPSLHPLAPQKQHHRAMRWRTQVSVVSSLPAQGATFLITFLLSLIFLRSSSTLYQPKSDAIYHPDTMSPDRPITSSIIVPAYHERDNLAPLVHAVFAAVRDPSQTEILIVDDNSMDGTIEECARLKKEEGYNVELLVRSDEKGLSSAVLRGFERARGSKMVVMDADLQVRLARL